MKVFISYSTKDTEIVRQFASEIEDCGDDVYWWSESKQPGAEAWASIFKWIKNADIVLAVITDATLGRAMAVGNEIGYARAKGKRIVPILSEGIQPTSLGCLIGTTPIKLRRDRLAESIDDVLDALDEKEARNRKEMRDMLIAAATVLLLLKGK